MKKYIIIDIKYKTYYSNFLNDMFVNNLTLAYKFNNREEADELIKKLPAGAYQIIKIYIND